MTTKANLPAPLLLAAMVIKAREEVFFISVIFMQITPAATVVSMAWEGVWIGLINKPGNCEARKATRAWK